MFATATARHRARPPFFLRKGGVRSIAVLGLALVLGGASVGIVNGAAQAAASTPSQYSAETFTKAAVGDATAYKKLTTSSTSTSSASFPCLTAGTNTTQTPVPGCSTTAIDATTGALRLTDAGGNEAAGLSATSAIPTSQGLDVTFDSYQYGGNGADGIAFYLAATDPFSPSVPSAAGAFGGSLGYSTDRTSNGIAGGYLGVGIDAFGNFQNKSYGGSNCTADTSTTATASVTVRGAGNGMSGYCIVSTSTLPTGAKLTGGKTATRLASDVPVEVAMNPTATAITSQGMTGANGQTLAPVTVPAMSYAVTYYPIGGTAQQTTTGALPKVLSGNAAYQSGWYDANGYPYKLTYGWTSSTGGSNDIHEVNRFVASSLGGQAPVLAATASTPTTVTYGSAGTYALQPSVASTGGTETGAVKVTSTFPTGTTPTSGTFTAGSYSCTTTGQTVVCTYPNTSGTAAGANLPALAIPFTETLNAGTTGAVITSAVASTDALKTATASSTLQISKVPTTASVTTSKNPSTYADAVTYTATLANTAAGGASVTGATGSVEFSADGTVFCTTTNLTAGVATCASNALTAGAHTVTARYVGDTNFATATSAAVTETVQQKATSLALTSNPSGVTYGHSSTLTATLPTDEKDATGTITFTGDDGETLTGTIANGVATATTSATDAVGTVTFTASYPGDTNYTGSTSNAATVTIGLAPTAITETVDGRSSDHVSYGTSATMAVTGLPADATGTVTFTNTDGTELCRATAATPTCTTSTDLGAGTYQVTARYLGDDRYAASSSNTVQLVVDKAAAPVITAAASPSSSTYGSPITLAEQGIPAGVGGTVTYTIDGQTACVATLPDTTCAPATAPTAGDHTLVATWDGDTDHIGATSAPVTVTVTRATVAIGATVDDETSASVPFGTAATLVATGLPAGADASSAVTFTVGSETLCTASAADASCPTATTLPAGTYSVIANWAGDANHLAVSSDAVTLTVTPQPTTIGAEVDGGPSDTIIHGDTATVTTTGLPSGVTGSVEYRLADGSLLGTGDASAAGAPVVTSAKLAAGTYQITAHYLGDADHAPSSAAAVQLVVAKRAPVLTDTVDGDSTGTTTFGTPATLAVGNVPEDATGTVEFRGDDGVLLCSVTLPALTCDTPATLAAGTYHVTATYTGDDDNEPATTTATATLTVDKAAGSVELGSATGGSGTGGTGTGGSGTQPGGSGNGTGTGSGTGTGGSGTGGTGTGGSGTGGSGTGGTGSGSAADVTSTFGAPVTFTATGLPAGATGTVTFEDADGATLCTIDLDADETSCRTDAAQAVGDYTVTPRWSGDANHDPATGTPFTFRILKAATAVTVTSGPATKWGTSTLLTVGGLPADATGTVTLRNGTTVLCTITLPATTCSTAAILPGTATVTADYSGDDAYDVSSATTPVVVEATHTVTPTAVQSGATVTVTAIWPAIPGAAGYTIVVSSSKDLGGAVRTITVGADATSVTIDGLDPGQQYWYRVSATAADGTLLGTHDATAVTAALPAVVSTPSATSSAPAAVATATATAAPPAATTTAGALAYTGSSLAVGLVGFGALLLVFAGILLLVAGRIRREDHIAPGPRRGLA